jgi:hypothetical protein
MASRRLSGRIADVGPSDIVMRELKLAHHAGAKEAQGPEITCGQRLTHFPVERVFSHFSSLFWIIEIPQGHHLDDAM